VGFVCHGSQPASASSTIDRQIVVDVLPWALMRDVLPTSPLELMMSLHWGKADIAVASAEI
jgi:hypothetical protein